jgi:hypothetical protein
MLHHLVLEVAESRSFQALDLWVADQQRLSRDHNRQGW